MHHFDRTSQPGVLGQPARREPADDVVVGEENDQARARCVQRGEQLAHPLHRPLEERRPGEEVGGAVGHQAVELEGRHPRIQCREGVVPGFAGEPTGRLAAGRLPQPPVVFGQCHAVDVAGHGDRAQQRAEVEVVAYPDGSLDPVGQGEAGGRLRAQEEGDRLALEARVPGQLGEPLPDRPVGVVAGAASDQSVHRRGHRRVELVVEPAVCEVRLRRRHHFRRQDRLVDGDAVSSAHGEPNEIVHARPALDHLAKATGLSSADFVVFRPVAALLPDASAATVVLTAI